MFKLLSSVALAACAGLWSTSNLAQAAEAVFELGNPTFFGSGCPEGSFHVITSPDAQTVSMLFSEFEASTTAEVRRVRKSCNLAVPVSVKPGFTLGIFRVDYRGYAFVPEESGGYADFTADYFFAGMRGPMYRQRYPAGYIDDVIVTNRLGVAAAVWSPCGAQTILRVNAAVSATKSTTEADDVFIQLDTADLAIERGFQFKLTYKNCTETSV